MQKNYICSRHIKLAKRVYIDAESTLYICTIIQVDLVQIIHTYKPMFQICLSAGT